MNTGFLVTLLTLSRFGQVENATRVLKLVCSNFYFIENYSFTNTLRVTILISCCAGVQGMQTGFDC